MERDAISFITDALISSDIQINRMDKDFNSIYGGNFGTSVKSVANSVKEEFLKRQFEYKSCENITTIILDICDNFKPENALTNFLSMLFKNIAQYPNTTNAEIKDRCLIPEKSQCKLDDNEVKNSSCIIIDSDDEDDVKADIPNQHSFADIDVFLINRLKFGIQSINMENIQFDKPILEESDYENHLFQGFIICLLYGFCELENLHPPKNEKVSGFIKLTHIIENISAKSKDIIYSDNIPLKKKYIDEILHPNGCSNPAIQVIATSFRAIIEAIKLHTFSSF